jgi:ribosomal protein S18 acetylase RimI-like enzyme
MADIRETLEQDADEILRIAADQPLFTQEEAETVGELLEDYLELEDHNGYTFLTASLEGEVVGFACFGPTPLTDGTFDLYWICVDVDFSRRGIGRHLIERVVAEVRALEGRMIVLDTSGTPEYEPTRAFYNSVGFTPTASVPDFYRPDDDLVIFSRRL